MSRVLGQSVEDGERLHLGGKISLLKSKYRERVNIPYRKLLLVQVILVPTVIWISVRQLGRTHSADKEITISDTSMSFYDIRKGVPGERCFSVQRSLLTKMYLKAWAKAWELFKKQAPQEVQALSPYARNESFSVNDTRLKIFIYARYTAFSSGLTFISENKLHVYYWRIYKAANDAIRKNLDALSKTKSILISKIPHKIPQNSFIFTFVRDPVDRWVAGYNELEHRWIERNYNISDVCSTCLFPQFKLGSHERVWAFLHDLLVTPQFAGLFEIEHVFPQTSGFHRVGKLDFMGRIERFDEDWNILLTKYIKRPEYQWNASLGTHESSLDTAGTKKAASALVQTSNAFKEILSLLLFFDYSCLGYSESWNASFMSF